MSRLTIGALSVVMIVVAAVGYFYGAVLSDDGEGYVGVAYAWGIFTPLLVFHQAEALAPLREWVNRLPTVAFFVLDLAAYVVLIAIGCAIAGTLLWWAGVVDGTWYDAARLPPQVLVYSLVVSGLTIFVLRLRDLVGRDVFLSLLTSRYRTPRREQRIFLFLDLIGSTSYAEKHGDLRTQQYLGEIFRLMSEPARRHGGSIDDYVGDSAIISWHFDKGVRQAACIRCALDIFAALRRRPELWTERFGEVPSLRAALHGGPVVTAEIGLDHHKITYFGDTVNTTARLEGLCRTLGEPFLVSIDLLSKIELPAGIDIVQKGLFNMRGRGQELAVASVAAKTLADWKPL